MTSGPDRSTVYRRWAWLCVALTVAGCLVGIAVPAGLGWDFANFYDAGRRVVVGQITDLYNPLSPIAGQPPQGRTGFFGAPISALFYVPLAPFSAETALVLFKIQNVIAFGATFSILLTFYRRFATGAEAQARFFAIFAFLFLIYQPFWTVFRVGGQTTPTVLLLLSLGLVAHTNSRLWTSAVCVVLSALIKPSLAPLVLFLACVSGPAYLWRTGVLLAGTGALSLLVMGWPVHESFLDLMAQSSRLTYKWHFNSSIYILIETLRLHVEPASAVGWFRMVFTMLTYGLKGSVVLTILWLWWRSRREAWTAAARRHFHFSLSILLFLLWSSTIWEHYLSLLFPFLIYVVAARRHFSRQAVMFVALIFVMCLGQNLVAINWLRYGFVFDSVPELICVTLFKSGPLLLTLMLLWRHADEWIRSYHDALLWE